MATKIQDKKGTYYLATIYFAIIETKSPLNVVVWFASYNVRISVFFFLIYIILIHFVGYFVPFTIFFSMLLAPIARGSKLPENHDNIANLFIKLFH